MPARSTDKALAYALLRIAFGVNFLGHGCFRILSGVPAFAATTGDHMTRSPLPHGFVVAFAYAIPFLEAALGLALILGILTRMALVCGALFLMALMVGVTSNQQWDVAGQQLVYSLIFFVLLYGVEHNTYSLDTLIRQKSELSLPR